MATNRNWYAASAAVLLLVLGTASPAVADVVNGTPGNDLLRGTPGADRISGQGGHDEVYGRGGDDRIFGGKGIDYLLDGPGNDVARGGPRFDDIWVGRGRDRIFGGAGDDQLYVRPDGRRDLLYCGPGQDDYVHIERPLEGKDRTRGCEHILDSNGSSRTHP